jgi:hypothetical protein
LERVREEREIRIVADAMLAERVAEREVVRLRAKSVVSIEAGRWGAGALVVA